MKKGFISIVGLIVTLIIIVLLAFVVFRTYFYIPGVDEDIKKSLSEYDIDTSSYESIIDSTRDRVKDMQKQLNDRAKQIQSYEGLN